MITPPPPLPAGIVPPLMRLVMHDAEHAAVIPSPKLDARGLMRLRDKLTSLPEGHYDYGMSLWIMPLTATNLEFFQRAFKPLEVAYDAAMSLWKRAEEKLDAVLSRRMKVRGEYHFGDKAPALPFTLPHESYKHQVVGTHSLLRPDAFALLMDMGTGKTKCVIDSIYHLSRKEKEFRVLIVCPNTLRATWRAEFKKWLPKSESAFLCISRSRWGLVSDIVAGLKSEQKIKVLITNYDKLARDANLELVKRWAPDMCVLDESDAIKSRTAKRTKALFKLRDYCKRRVILTGTPNPNSLVDLWAQFNWLRPGLLGFQSYDAFREHYCVVDMDNSWRPIIGYRHVDELKKHLARHSFTVRKSDCLDLPPKLYETRTVEMTKKHRAIYEQMVETLIAELDEIPANMVTAQVIIVKLLRLSQICGGFVNTLEGGIRPVPEGDCKMKELEAFLEALPTNTRTVIWARFREEIRQIEMLLKKHKKSCATLFGDTTPAARQELVERFNSDDDPLDFVVGNPQTGGQGITLVGTDARPAATVIYYSNSFSYRDRAQSEDRCHRIGTKRPIVYVDLQCERTIDGLIQERLAKKSEGVAMLKDLTVLKDSLLGVGQNGNGAK